ncbi:MAG: adenylyltransferase/cytidyltransferase family protein [Candidatus Anammoximicrobium sp.]|nr:adenylyltransferase/cytidyltransferase family protein [Candidatus Anammoximicrobium sp.]
MPNKIASLEELAKLLEKYRRRSQVIVQCHGVFDLLHIGHIRYLQAARQLGDVLVVTVTADEFVNKGPHRPVFEERLRAQALAALDCVDHVSIHDCPTATEALRRLRPDVYVKGAEYRDDKTPELLAEEAEAAALGIRVEFIEEIRSSSSFLINNYLSPFTDKADQYLLKFRRGHTAKDVLGGLAQARDLRVLVVGEAILDEYVTCSTLGQATKSPNVVGRFLAQERYLGGALAVANHLAGFCREVRLISLLGREQTEEEWIRAQLRPAVQARFLYKPGAPTIVKRQYREVYYANTLFELNYLDETPLADSEVELLDQWLRGEAAGADVVVVADYGHTMLGPPSIRAICERARYLVASTPANAANLGYHTISQYPRADYLCLAEHDLRLDRRSRSGDVAQLLVQVAQGLQARLSAVTVGSKGCLCYGPEAGFAQAPALATRVVDRFGAAESFLAVTSLCAALRVPLEILAFLGNVAGAEAVAVMGNSQFLEEAAFRRHVESLLK